MSFKHLIQISDIHIRAGDSQQSRYTEYETQIDRLLEALETYDPEETVITVLGDVFHDKYKIGPSAQMLAQRLLNGLSRFPTVVIRGNHDYRQDQPDEPDLIKPFFDHNPENLHYYNETGLYQLGNIEFGVVAVQDTLLRGAAGGIATNLPVFPEPTTDDESVEHRIALFHGSFGGAFLQNGSEVDDRNNYPINGWIPETYTLQLFGDIHVQQVHRAKKELGNEFTSREKKNIYMTDRYKVGAKTPWAYSGSLVQQNFGESLWGHGFVVWNLEQKTATCYHIRNDTGLVVVQLNSKDEPCIKFRSGRTYNIISVATAIQYGWFPTQISLRFATNARTMIQPIQTLFEEAGIVVRDTGFVEDTNLEDSSTAVTTPEAKTDLINDLSSLNSPQTWVKYFTESAKLEDGDWSQWVHHPLLLMTPTDAFDGPIQQKITERNTKLRKTVESYIQSRDVKAPVRLFRIHYMEFSNLLCFGSHNWMDFDEFKKDICLVNGTNGAGKTSLLEVICLSLYGESFPSRFNKSYSAAVINQNRKANEPAYTRILISVNNVKFWVTRTYEPAPKNPKNLWQRSVKLIDAATNEVTKQTANVVDPWILENIGPFEHFLLTTIMSQGQDSDFFAMSSKDQKFIIDSLLHLNVCEDFKTILKEAKLNHEYALTNLQSYESGVKSTSEFVAGFQNIDIPALESKSAQLKEEYSMLEKSRSEAKQHCSDFAERLFQTPLEDYQKEQSSLLLVKPTEDSCDMTAWRTDLRDRLAVLRTKKYPHSTKPVSCRLSFDELESTLTELKVQRLKSGASTRIYDSAAHAQWQQEKQAWLQAKHKVQPTTASFEELQRLRAHTAEEFTGIEMNEAEFPPISAKVLAGLEKQHNGLTQELDELDSDIKVREKELLNCEIPPNQQKRLTQYKVALEELKTGFGVTIDEANQRIQRGSELTTSLQFVESQIVSLETQLKEHAEAKYSASCTACKTNPFRHKKEELTQSKEMLSKQQLATQAELKQLFPKTLDALKHAYETVKSFLTDKTPLLLDQEERSHRITKELKALRITYAQKEEEREELEYETMQSVAQYYELKAKLHILELQYKAAQYKQEELEWTQAEANAALDTRIAKLQDDAASAYTAELKTTMEELKKVEEIIHQHDAYLHATRRADELTKLIAAYPYWQKYVKIEARMRPLSQEINSLDAQLSQAASLKSKLEQARSQAQRITTFREVLEKRTALIKQMSEGFDNYTDWLYPTKVGPAIQDAVNKVLSSIALPRPIKLVAEWENSHFTWLVHDGNNKPPYEKCSGAQRFFVSLALRFAFSRMGASNMINAQIFLDEGFTACDTETMDRVPTLLSSLLKELDYLQTIFIVSHMDTLKSIATRQIMITRGASASQVQIGERKAPPRAQATKATAGTTKHLAPSDEATEGEVFEAIPIPTKTRGRPKKAKEQQLQMNDD